MTPAALEVLCDAAREAGFEHLTPWHLRCVEAYLAQLAGAHPLDERAATLHDRVRWDLNNTLDELRDMAEREDDEVLARAMDRAMDARRRALDREFVRPFLLSGVTW